MSGDPESGFGVYLAANAMGDMSDLAVKIINALIDENASGDVHRRD